MNRRNFFFVLFAPVAAALTRLFPKPKPEWRVTYRDGINKRWYAVHDLTGNLMVGYKGTSHYDAGYFYAPYIPLQRVPAEFKVDEK